eukprot:TRINITY_DN247_c0_g1_i2.p1 TRINITY_DN247_c0_g1~~TRINITY_DN247_c0_g1_i2.p1  ORF type:complete len:293 (+),score=79.66 TRINITY_DN247_c0_g1_i2:949-1827(+)
MESTEIQLSENQIQLGSLLGSGAYSQVYKGKYSANEVAVKQPLRGHRLDRECSIMKRLHHPHLIQYLGAYRNQNSEVCMVMEFMECGTLLDASRSGGQTDATYLSIAYQVASAMRYLEEMQIVHCDLSARNILLRPSDFAVFTAKISDFGMARSISEMSANPLPVNLLPVRWTSPEILEDVTKATYASDVWSFGVVLWEMFNNGLIPYGDMDNEQVSRQVKKVGSSLVSSKSKWPEVVEEIAKSCFEVNPGNRPNFAKIASLLSVYEKQNAKPIEKDDELNNSPFVYSTKIL